MNIIEFRGLGLHFGINPVAIDFAGIRIYWYGIIISLGFLAGLMVLLHYVRKFKYNEETILDLVLICAPTAVIGARLYYVVFRFSDYVNNPMEIFKVWHGGLAIYGAIIATIITVFIYCKVKKLNVWQIADMGAPGFIIAQAIGRWGNFVNQEAYGRETSLPWAMTINENGIYKSVHPTFLYESLWNFTTFLVLTFFFRKYKKADGEVFALYIGMYSLGRVFIEGLRADSLYLGYFRISQIVALIFISFSVILFAQRRRKSAEGVKS